MTRLNLPHTAQKSAEEIVAVVRAGRGFGVVLHAEGRQFAVGEAFDGAVVQAAVGNGERVGQRGLS